MSDKRRLIYAIVDFLNREMEGDTHSEDAKESLEVASQCLQTAFTLSHIEDTHLKVDNTLESIFQDATKGEPLKKKAPPTEEEKEKAEKLKLEGNDLMRSEQFEKAVEMYTKAIELNSSSPVFYCNRAAAFSKMNNHYAAVEDCRRAIDMDVNYGKAYARMGLAYSSVEKHKEAVDCFKKAMELEPENEGYKNNLQLAQDKLKEAQDAPRPAMPAIPGMPMGPGGMDLGGLLNNPALMNMASTMMSDPAMQNLMGQMMSGGMAQGGNSMEGLITAGQRLAEQMQQSNPDLVENLRRQMQQNPDGGANPDGANPDENVKKEEDKS